MNNVGKAEAISQLSCMKCGYKWFPRTTSLPKCCPRCKNFDWMGGNSKWETERDVRPKAQSKPKIDSP